MSCGGSPGGRWRAPWSSLQNLQMREVMIEDSPLSRHQYAPRMTQQSITTEPVSILIPPTAKPLLMTEPQSQAGKHSDTLYTHTNKPSTSSSFKTFENPPHHSFETYCVLHMISKSTFKSTISSNVTLSHTTSSKIKKFL